MQNLPTELRLIIISDLDNQTLRALRLANTEWFNIIRYWDFKFRKTTAEMVPQILARLAQYSWPIGLTFELQQFPLKDYCEDIAKLTQLTKLEASFKGTFGEDLHPFTKLTNLEHIGGYVFPSDIIRHLTKLKTISVISLNNAKYLDLTRFQNLEEVYWTSKPSDAEDPLSLLNCKNTLAFLEIEDPPLAMDESQLSKFTRPKMLKLTCERRSTFNLPHLPYLEYLHLRVDPNLASSSSVDEDLVERIGKMTSLNRLQLKGVCQTEKSLSLLTGLPNLTHLVILAVTDKMTGVTLTLLTSLEQLYISGACSNMVFDEKTLKQRNTRLTHVHIK